MAANKTVSLVIIIILLLATITAIVLGVYGKTQTPEVKNEILEFTVGNVKIGEYTCTSGGYCTVAPETIDDKSLDFYNDSSIDKLEVMNNKYAFVLDGKDLTTTDIKIHDLINNTTIGEYQQIKNYTVGIEDNILIVKKSGYWGLIKLTETGIEELIPNQYDYIGLHNVMNNDQQLINDEFLVLSNDKYMILNPNGLELSTSFDDEIIAYNGNYLITKNNEFSLYDYRGNELLIDIRAENIILLGRYAAVYDQEEKEVKIIEISSETVSSSYEYSEINEITIEIQNGIANVISEGEIIDQIRLS